MMDSLWNIQRQNMKDVCRLESWRNISQDRKRAINNPAKWFRFGNKMSIHEKEVIKTNVFRA